MPLRRFIYTPRVCYAPVGAQSVCSCAHLHTPVMPVRTISRGWLQGMRSLWTSRPVYFRPEYIRRIGLAASALKRLDCVWSQRKLSITTKLRIYSTCMLVTHTILCLWDLDPHTSRGMMSGLHRSGDAPVADHRPPWPIRSATTRV